jgi:hypothetical protein
MCRMYAFGFGDLGAGVGKHVELAAAGADFLQVALELFEQLVGRGHGDDGHVLVHQGQRAVLELAGGVGFGVDVGDFLELEGAFQGDGVVLPRPRKSAWCLPAKRWAQRSISGSSSSTLATATGRWRSW